MAGSTPALTHVYTDDGPRTIGITAIDPYGVYTTSKAVSIAHVPPAIQSLAATSANEGAVTQLSGTMVDPNVNDSHVLNVDWGDGATNSYSYAVGVQAFNVTHVYANNPPSGTYTVNTTITDNKGGSGTAATTAAVANVAPTISSFSTTASTTTEGGTTSVLGSLVDPGTLDSHTVMIAWGDGTQSAATVDDTTHLFTASHQYIQDSGAGTYALTATVTDSDGATGRRARPPRSSTSSRWSPSGPSATPTRSRARSRR